MLDRSDIYRIAKKKAEKKPGFKNPVPELASLWGGRNQTGEREPG